LKGAPAEGKRVIKPKKRAWILGGIVFVAFLAAAIGLPWQEGLTLTDGCICGREREFLQVSFSQHSEKRFYNMKIKSPGDAKHRHNYWDSNSLNEFFISPWQERKLIPCEINDESKGSKTFEVS
jgi:hypothetical protein